MMAETTQVQIGDYTATCVRDTMFAVDGGAMFHIVPKKLWSRKVKPDEANRIYTGLNCLLVIGNGKTILYDVGIGNKLSDKLKKIYGLMGDTTLLASLKEAGVAPADIDYVVPSHLHLDHAGWLTIRDDSGELVPTFPNARVIVQQAEWEVAHDNNELTRGSYIHDDFDPLAAMGLIDFIDGDHELVKGITLKLTGAHSPGHQALIIVSGGQTLLCPCELVPSTWHLRLSWVTGYDQEPVRVVDAKKELMQQASANNWLVFLTHDPEHFFGHLQASDHDYRWQPLVD
jgi:glyoxylase-like metal-dependent hydrolase (beta-lactamase superfamily II)